MEEKFLIKFRKGGVFTGLLLTNEAPRTCEAFLKQLPMHVKFKQARFAGEEFYCDTEMLGPHENEVLPKWGDLVFSPEQDWRSVGIYYGEKILVRKPHNLFARIVSNNLDDLRRVGERVWLEGAEDALIEILAP